MNSVSIVIDKGLFKSRNDDRALVDRYVMADGAWECQVDGNSALLAICDGVGGEKAGDVAAVETLNIISNERDGIIENHEEKLLAVIGSCEDRLVSMARENPAYEGMSTTLTGLILKNGSVMTFNLGNSRVCRFRNGILKQLTRDDSVVQDLVDAGTITAKEAETAPNRNVITKCVTSKGRYYQPAIKLHDIEIEEGDIFCLYSDGVSDYVSDEEIEDILYSDELKLTEKAIEIVKIAKSKEYHDNISIILMEVTS